jgi:hypothetical protein
MSFTYQVYMLSSLMATTTTTSGMLDAAVVKALELVMASAVMGCTMNGQRRLSSSTTTATSTTTLLNACNATATTSCFLLETDLVIALPMNVSKDQAYALIECGMQDDSFVKDIDALETLWYQSREPTTDSTPTFERASVRQGVFYEWISLSGLAIVAMGVLALSTMGGKKRDKVINNIMNGLTEERMDDVQEV